MQAMAGAEFGGAEAFFVRLVRALHRAGLEQRVLIRENKARANSLRDAGIEPLELPFGGMLDRRTPRAFKHEIKTFQPQIVMTWMNRASKMCPKGDFVQVGRLGGYYDLKYYRTCDHLIGNTEDIVSHIVGQGWDKSRAHYLPNFVSEDQAGDGPLRESLEKQAEDLGIKPRVRFLGWREDTAELFAACDLFVCPSRHEPLGNVVLEAWAQGVPVIAADSMGPGTLIDHMDSGILVPVDDSDALARAVRAVIDDYELADHIARRGREVYEDRFTEGQVVQRYLDFFQSIVTNREN